jgi:hypothetical protein
MADQNACRQNAPAAAAGASTAGMADDAGTVFDMQGKRSSGPRR